MPRCPACGSGELPGREAPPPPPPPPEAAAARPGQRPIDGELREQMAARTLKFVARALLLLVWLYLYDSMKRYVIGSIEGDTWYRMFIVIIIAVPMTDVFVILASLFLD